MASLSGQGAPDLLLKGSGLVHTANYAFSCDFVKRSFKLCSFPDTELSGPPQAGLMK